MFGCRHVPTGDPRAGVVICSSIQSEFIKNLRRESLLGRALASRGFAVQRFHYRGTGNSFGDESRVTFDTLCEDALTAAARLMEDHSLDRIAFVGTRLGALVAARAAAQLDSPPLVLWDPVTEATTYFRELFRFWRMKRLVEGTATPESAESPTRQLKHKGILDLFGYAIPEALYDSLQGRTLVTELGDLARSLLLVQFGDQASLRGEYARSVDLLEKSRFTIETRRLLEPQAWWFFSVWKSDDLVSGELIETTCDWIEEQLDPQR